MREDVVISLPTRRRNITPLGDLINGIPDESRTKEIIDQLEELYLFEMEQINRYEKGSTSTSSTLLPFKKQGSQHIAEFFVNDMNKNVDYNKFNFHGQNVSQWLYAGCILFDESDQRISCHH